MSRLMLRSLLLGSALPLFNVVPASAQQAESPRYQVTLDTITILDTRRQGSAIEALAGVTTTGDEELARQQPASTAEILRRIPGVGATQSGDDSSVAVNIRGLQQMGRVVVTVDGARQDFWRVGHGSGSFYVDPDLLKQVTVIRGPSSNSYGSGGIGGVVAFETKDAADLLHDDESWSMTQRLRYGTNGEGWGTTTTAATRLGADVEALASLTYRDSNPYKDGNGDEVRWTGERLASGLAKLNWRPAAGHELKFTAMRQQNDDVISGSSGSTSSTLSRYDADSTTDTLNLSYTFDPDDNDLIDLEIRGYHTATDNRQTQVWPESRLGEGRFYKVITNGFSVQNSARFDAGGWDQTISAGADYALIKGSSDADHFGAGRQELWGTWLQWQGQRDIFEVIASLRYDSYDLDGTSKATDTEPEREVSLSGNRWSPRLSLGAEVAQGVQLFASYSEGYRAPHLQEVFRKNGSHGSGYEPNLLLRPETAKSWEIGANIQRDGLFMGGDYLRAKVTAFRSDVENYIDTTRVDAVTRYENVGKAKLDGVEIEGSYDFIRGYVDLGASFVNARMVDGVNEGMTLSNTPLDSVTARLGLRAFDDRLDYGIEYQHLGDVARVSSSSTIHYPKVDLVNLYATWQETDDYRIDFGIDNLFDKAYTDPQSGWATTSDIEQGRGRTLRISFTKRLGG